MVKCKSGCTYPIVFESYGIDKDKNMNDMKLKYVNKKKHDKTMIDTYKS